ncbi:hypothetical protein P0Y35_09510 [Kiritimatiellaeota bacterium B1221]|nr:hypothetical protein [Kiritimatiellaeota bacterium B1221]
MKNESIDVKIDAVRARTIPSCPSDLESRVLRRIRLSTKEQSSDVALFPRLAPICFAAVIAVVVSAGTSLRFATQSRKSIHDRQQARTALNFDVFHNDAFKAGHRSSR